MKVVVFGKSKQDDFDPCSSRYIYVHHLPSKFNEDLVKNCRSLNIWFDMYPYISNKGFGERIEDKILLGEVVVLV